MTWFPGLCDTSDHFVGPDRGFLGKSEDRRHKAADGRRIIYWEGEGTGVIIYCVLLHHAVAAAAMGAVRYLASKPHQIHVTCNSDLWLYLVNLPVSVTGYWLLVTRNV